MWTVKNFLGGQALYDQVATVYGPFYYLYEWCALSLTGVSAASDSLRLVSVAFWVAAALIAFVLVYRATGSLLLAVCVHLLVFRALGFIGEEPAHPQEACILLLARARPCVLYRQPHAAHGHDGGAWRRHGGLQNQSRSICPCRAGGRPRLRTTARMAPQRRPYCGIARSPCPPRSTDVGPPHRDLGRVLLRPGGPVSRLRPADRKGHAPGATACAGYATRRSSQAPLSPLRRPFPALHWPAAAPCITCSSG